MSKQFYSFCSAHQVTNEKCPICKIGSWHDEKEQMQYVCACGNSDNEQFDYAGKEGNTRIYICKECDKVIRR